jgi:GAF domain-containing protein
VNNVFSANKNDFNVLSRKVLITIVKYMGLKMGALYVINDEVDSPHLERVAQYGGNKEMLEKFEIIEPSSGLVGASFSDNQFQIINDLPDKFYDVNSGLGSSRPNTLLLAPLSTDEAVYGVIELARFGDFKPEEIEFIKKISFSIASSLNTARINEKNVALIEQFQLQAIEIGEKEEKMRENLHELEYYREQYEKLKQELDSNKKS